VHTWARRLILPWFSHTRVDSYEQTTRDLCNRLIDGFIESGRADAAQDYAQQIPVRIIALILGVPGELADTFTGLGARRARVRLRRRPPQRRARRFGGLLPRAVAVAARTTLVTT